MCGICCLLKVLREGAERGETAEETLRRKGEEFYHAQGKAIVDEIVKEYEQTRN